MFHRFAEKRARNLLLVHARATVSATQTIVSPLRLTESIKIVEVKAGRSELESQKWMGRVFVQRIY